MPSAPPAFPAQPVPSPTPATFPSRPIYDLFDEPWIPVLWRAGTAGGRGVERPGTVGLHQLLLCAHEIEQVAVAVPPALSALYRVLYAVTARLAGLDEAGPRDGAGPQGDWSERRVGLADRGFFDPAEVEAFVADNRHRFDLFHPVRPFLQDPRLAGQCDPQNTAGVDKLITTRPSGNNHAWFRHVDAAAPNLPSPAEAVLHLLVWHYYGPSGRCSSRTAGDVKAANSSAGPLRSSLSYHPEGESLFETLLAGLPEPGARVSRATDLCPWEWVELPDPAGVPPVLKGRCSELTARSQHALLLVPDATGGRVKDAFITWAYRDKISREGDPYLIWQTSKEGNAYPRPADSQRALWRDLDALLLKDPAGSAEPRRPAVFFTAAEVSEYLRVRALGFEQDGQAKDVQFVDATTPPVLELAEENEPELAVQVGRLRMLGERYGNRLDRAVKKAWAVFTEAPKIRDCTWAVDAAARYWPAAEAEFWRRLNARDFDGAAAAFRLIAERAYDTVTHGALGTLRGAKACSGARVELYGGPVKATPKTAVPGRSTNTENT
ncbi:type I-E CRISPR-associated protein Cse1/CasA [Kitasatospora sp. NPDC088351]|uniref:type I-E CRISPR-associated protein Cse1/CasA n=1 Tax=Kitasatospora sp. NPDC088351 TaxID=3155180 RepID=UPI003433103E